MEIPVAEIALVFSYLNNNGGKEVVKKASMDFYNWLKGRLPGNGPKKLEALKEKPADEPAQNEAKKILAAANEFNILPTNNLQTELQKVLELLKKEDADWFEQQKGSIIQHHSGTGDNVGRDKIGRQINQGPGSTYNEGK